jgi:hypothetical protein
LGSKREVKRVLMFVSFFKLIKKPEQEANLQTGRRSDRCKHGLMLESARLAVSAVDDVDI